MLYSKPDILNDKKNIIKKKIKSIKLLAILLKIIPFSNILYLYDTQQ